jgi:hypothetical protein
VGRFTLEIVEPVTKGPLPADEEELASALDAIATVHGGKVVESAGRRRRTPHRVYVNIFDCESSLEREVAWLSKRFPEVRFTLKQLM